MKYMTNDEEQPSTEKNTRANHCMFRSCLFGRNKNTFFFKCVGCRLYLLAPSFLESCGICVEQIKEWLNHYFKLRHRLLF